jgi:hypothetical protein
VDVIDRSVECVCEIRLFGGLLKYNIIVKCVFEIELFGGVIEV